MTVVGLFASIVSDQVLIMCLSGALHLWGRSRVGSRSHEPSPIGDAGLCAPEETMALPADATLAPDAN